MAQATPYGFDLAASIGDSIQNAGGIAQLQSLKAQQQRDAVLQANAPAALQGDPNALKSVMTADPESGMKIQQFMQSADKAKLDHANMVAGNLGSIAGAILKAPDNEIQQAYAWGLDTAKKQGLDISAAPRTSDPTIIRNYLGMIQQQAMSVKDQMQVNKPPTSVQEYKYGQENPGFARYQQNQKAAGATRVNVDARGQALSPLWDITKDRIKAANSQIQSGQAIRPQLEQVIGGLEGGLETGRIKDLTRPLRQILNEAGVKVDPKLPQEELVKSAMSYIIPRMRVAGSGSTSDFEARLFTQAAPNFQNTREGNILIAKGYIQQQDYLQKESDLLKEYAMQNGGSDVGFQDYAKEKLGDLFPRPQSDDDYKAVSKGTVYLDPEGQFRVKGMK